MKIIKIWFGHKSWDPIEIGSPRDNLAIVKDIKEHQALGEGDKWYWEVSYSDGSMARYFNVERVDYICTNIHDK